jgi:4-hydroxybenzoate polyprenyltransferase
MFQNVKGFAHFISAERGLMLFMISIGATFLIVESMDLLKAVFLGVIAFCGWSAVDALNNIFDADLDRLSDPIRAEYTKRLGKVGLIVAGAFTLVSLILGSITMMPWVVLLIGVGLFFGVLYSVPPFRLRKTMYKPIVNMAVGSVPVLIVAAFFNVFSPSTVILALLVGVTTSVNSLWEDLADYKSDFSSGSKTVPIIFGFRRGLFLTIIMGYVMLPLMVCVGLQFQLGWVYYAALFAVASFVSLRLFQKRVALFKGNSDDMKRLLQLGEVLAKDFVIIAIVFTFSLMLSGLLKINPIIF